MRRLTTTDCATRDGVRLYTVIFLPDEAGQYPVILLRTPYGCEQAGMRGPLYGHYADLVDAGFAVAYQDVRGTGESEGTLGLSGQREHEDGADAVAWLAAQPWCNGRVGMFGLSYPGFVQTAAASQRPPQLRAVCPFMCPSQNPFGMHSGRTLHMQHLYWAYAQIQEHPDKYIPCPADRPAALEKVRAYARELDRQLMTLPLDRCPAALVDGIPILEDYVRGVQGVEDSAYWQRMHMPIDFSQVHCAAFFATGWFDVSKRFTFEGYLKARESADSLTRDNACLLVGPWTHGDALPSRVEDLDFGPEASGEAQDVRGMHLNWFERHLMDKPVSALPARVRYFMMGENKWHDAADWPPPEAKMLRLYLTGERALAPVPEETPSIVAYEADPMNPNLSDFTDSAGRGITADWAERANDPGVVVFLSEALEKPVAAAGILRATLCAVTDAPDTDFACRLVDVFPDGRQLSLAAGLIRAKYRHGVDAPEPVTPGQTEVYDWQVDSFANVFLPGHRIGLHVASYQYPLHNRNLNTGEAPAGSTRWAVAHQRLLCGGVHASCIELPCCPDDKEETPWP